MIRRQIRKFYKDLRRPPSVQDVQSVIRTSGAGGCVTAINALIFVALGAPHQTPLFLMAWCALTLIICVVVFVRTRRANARKLTHVSRKAVRRLNVFAAVLALPWATLAFVKIALIDAASSLIVIMVCAGMSAGGTFMLHRTMMAALIYYSLILGAVVVSAHIGGNSHATPITFYAFVYGAFLCYFGLRTAETARDLDRSVDELEATVSKLELSQKQNHQLANIDGVTGLPNRTAFNRHLDTCVQSADAQTRFALLLLDLDHFKNVNDLYGHAVGDDLLGHIAARLEKQAGKGSFVARLGGDEFVVLLPGHGGTDALACARNLIQSLNEPVALAGKQIYPGASIGVAEFPVHGARQSALTRNADLALNQAKETGRGIARVFDETLRNQAVLRDRLETALRAALNGDQITVCYQPKIRLSDQTICGAEALVRWHNPDLGASSPDLFLPVAAESGLFPALSQRITEIVARDMQTWREMGLAVGKIALNVHPLELRSPELLINNIDYLGRQGISSTDLTIEVTEGCLIGRGSEAAQFTLDRLAERGYELSLDDFGTGFASLSHLRSLPVAEIKIDKSFVSAVPDSPSDRAIVAATIQLARGMGLRTVAEGIENIEQLTAMRELRVDLGQGYLWAPALPPEDFAAFLNGRDTKEPREASG